jgi:GNAT superfamily N-acetyltransferase
MERAFDATGDALPEYNSHGDVVTRYWRRLVEERPDFQFSVFDGAEPLVVGHTLPLRWDQTIDDLPAGIDGAVQRGFDEDDANVLCALLIEVAPARQGGGLSRLALESMAAVAREHGLDALIAPVRPNWKERYPLTPIERYVEWRREDGLLFDPWMRVHERLGARILKPEPRSLRITGTVAEWETWTEMAFPESGEYVFPRGLSVVAIDRAADVGAYWEPNVWMLHAWE